MSWRAALGLGAEEGEALALGIELRVRAAHDERIWAPRVYDSASPEAFRDGEGEFVLGMRPLRRSTTTGAWIQGDVGWDLIRRSPHRFGAYAARWFGDLLSLARESLIAGSTGEWLVLDRVESGLLWPLLREGAQHGIPLVAARGDSSVVVGAHADLRLRAATGRGGSLSLRAQIHVDGRTVPATRARRIGSSGAYLVEVDGNRLLLTLIELPEAQEIPGLLGADGAVLIPEEERAAFLTEVYPRLIRAALLEPDEGVGLPPLPPPQLDLHCQHRAGDVIEFSFSWSYGVFGRFSADGAAGAPVRDAETERLLWTQTAQSWREEIAAPMTARGRVHGIAAAEFHSRLLPSLREQGVIVTESGTVTRYRELEGDPVLTVRLVETAESDWFDLGVHVAIDGRHIPFTPLFRALSEGRKRLLLVDGSHFPLTHPALDRLRELLEEAGFLPEEESGPRLHRDQLTLWEDFEDLADESEAAVTWRTAAEGLRSLQEVPQQDAPEGLRAVLRPYQHTGFSWLALLWQHRLGGILADDMGLGKTLQMLAFLSHTKASGERRPFLVIAPTSVLTSWVEEAERFAPGLRVIVCGSTRDARGEESLGSRADVVLTSYTIARLAEEFFRAVSWAGVILDEAQVVKNPATKIHQAIMRFPADAVYAMTGTPLENSLGELWALLSLTAPGLFPSARRFRQEYIQPIEQGKLPENAEGSDYRERRIARLRRRMRPFLVRRTKELVAAELPEKQEQVLAISLSPAHRARYDVVLQRERQKVLGLIEDMNRNRFILFRSLTVLRMMSLAPGLLDPEDVELGSRKLDVLVERLMQLRAEGHRALVFSQFTSYLRMAEERLAAAGLATEYLDGATRNRKRVIDRFRSGDATAFLISLKAGGVGLTLTEADYVFLLDPWWNPQTEAQAIDRTHRIGQQHPVLVYRLIAEDTIEQKVLALQQRKARLFRSVLDEGEFFAKALSADDIRDLFL